MKMKKFLRILGWLVIVAVLNLIFVYLINLQVQSYSNGKIYKSVETVPNEIRIAIVL